jgi:hypothetical protein
MNKFKSILAIIIGAALLLFVGYFFYAAGQVPA